MLRYQFLIFTTLVQWVGLTTMQAQPNYPAPTGVWCSCPPTTSTGSISVMPAVATKPYVDGILVRVAWKDLETADNTYNWALIDSQITAAQTYGKKIALAVGGGPNSPTWLFNQGAQSLSFTIPFSGTIPIPWDTIFLTKWTEFITALGNRYADDTTIQLVYLTHSTSNGFEMQLPFNPTPSYTSISYTDQKVIDSWKQIIDTYNTAFPNHYLTNDFHPVNSSNTIADSVYAYANLTIGNRYGANAWWWTQNNTTVYPSQYAILQDSSTTNQFTGIQMAQSGTDSPDSFGAGGLPTALNLAISNHICYWEIWNSDIIDGSFDTLFTDAACSPLDDSQILTNNLFKVYPNPSNGIFTIESALEIQEIELVNAMGQTILNVAAIQSETYLLDIKILKRAFIFSKFQLLKTNCFMKN
jgi:hypothetical protein